MGVDVGGGWSRSSGAAAGVVATVAVRTEVGDVGVVVGASRRRFLPLPTRRTGTRQAAQQW